MKNLLRNLCAVILMTAALKGNAQVPNLNSHPSASAVIFLDFDGHTVANTSWNYAGNIYCGASGLDNSQITTVFNRVAEDYRPFNVNITTDSTKFWAAPIDKRMRVILTVSYEWYGVSGGVAFVNSFTWGDNTPCFVFTSLHSFNVKNIAEASSHEAGHTLGLYHQSVYNASCVKINEYNAGQGAGEIGWAPIMGNGYYQNMTLWNNGQSSMGCSDYQNDLEVITNGNGFTYRTDDHPNTFGASTLATFSGNQFNVNGVVEQNTDFDMFRFTQPAFGRFQLNAVPYNVGTGNAGSDLDLQVTLYNSSQAVLSVYNPGTLLNSIADTTLNPGTYYLRIEGRGNIYAPQYASLGSYSINAIFSASDPLPLRRLELSGAVVNDKHKLTWLIDADEQVVEQTLEISTDGISFSPVIQSPAAARSFIYKPYVSGAAQYRLSVLFDNGRQHYSNTITLRSTGETPRPRLVSNLVNSHLSVTSPGIYNYSIVDLNGKISGKGQLTSGANTIQVNNLTSGVYFIRFNDVNVQWVEKFIRQ